MSLRDFRGGQNGVYENFSPVKDTRDCLFQPFRAGSLRLKNASRLFMSKSFRRQRLLRVPRAREGEVVENFAKVFCFANANFVAGVDVAPKVYGVIKLSSGRVCEKHKKKQTNKGFPFRFRWGHKSM